MHAEHMEKPLVKLYDMFFRYCPKQRKFNAAWLCEVPAQLAILQCHAAAAILVSLGAAAPCVDEHGHHMSLVLCSAAAYVHKSLGITLHIDG
jgi:hypothetical protein